MKMFIYLVTTLFFLQTSLGSVAWAEASKPEAPATVPESEQAGEMAYQYGLHKETSKTRLAEILKMRQEKPYSSLFVKESVCAGKEKELSGFINEVPKTDGNGNETAEKTKGSLFENELELAERNFDFDKILNARFNQQNDFGTMVCLDLFAKAAIGEWANYFEKRSKQFECGLSFNRKDEQSPIEVDENAGERKDTCDISYANGKLYDFYKAQMDKLKDIINSYDKKGADEEKKMREAQGEPSRTQADLGCNGPDCQPTSTEAKTTEELEKIKAKECCDRIGERFEILGFTTMKDVKPNERVCNQLIDKEADNGYCDGSFCIKTIGDCVKNFASVFLRDFFKSLVSSFDVLGWGSQLMTMVRELISDPYEAAKNIVKNMFGFDGVYMECLNKKSQAQYVCQMIGKFAGGSAGFSAGLGGIIGLASGIGKGFSGKLGASSSIGTIRPILKEAARSGARAAAVGAVWPYYAGRGIAKGTVGAVKGTWKYTPIAISKTTKAVISAPYEISGRLIQGTGRLLFRKNTPELIRDRALLNDAANPVLQRAKEIRSSTKPSAAGETTAAKYDTQISQGEAAVKLIDDEIAALEKKQIELTNGKTWKNGRPSFATDTKGFAEYNSTVKKINDLKKSKAEAEADIAKNKKEKTDDLEKLGASEAATRDKIWKNVKGVVGGTGAAGSMYPLNPKDKEKDKKSGEAAAPAAGDPKVAPAVEGVGTGETIPGTSATPKPEVAKPPVGKPASAPSPANGSSEKTGDAPPAAPPGFSE